MTVKIKDNFKIIIRMSAPIIMLSLSNISISIFFNLILSHINPNALAAGALIGVIQVSVIMVFTAPILIFSSLVAHEKEKKPVFNSLGNWVLSSSIFALLLSIPAMFIMHFIPKGLLLFGQDPEIVHYTQQYFHSFTFVLPLLFIFTAWQQVLMGLGELKLCATLSVIGLLVFIIMSCTLTFGKVGFPVYGITGIGYAQIIRITLNITILFCLVKFLKKTSLCDFFHFSSSTKLESSYSFLRLGSPLMIHALAEFPVIIILTLLVGWMGVTNLLIFQITAQISMVVSIFLLSLSQVGNLFISKNKDEQSTSIIIVFSKHIIFFAIGFVLIIGLLAIINVKNILNLYIEPNSNIELTSLSLYIFLSFITQIFYAVKIVSTGLLRGFLDTKSPMYFSVVSNWLIILPISLLSAWLGGGIYFLAFSQLIGTVVCAYLLLKRLNARLNKR